MRVLYSGRRRPIDAITVASGHIEYLVNNAGFAQAGAIEEVSQAETVSQFDTNFYGLVSPSPSSAHGLNLNFPLLARSTPRRRFCLTSVRGVREPS